MSDLCAACPTCTGEEVVACEVYGCPNGDFASNMRTDCPNLPGITHCRDCCHAHRVTYPILIERKSPQ